MSAEALNAICPYYTMFPLAFPLKHLEGREGVEVLDPFCGRGTSLFAARLLGLPSMGIDSNPVAVAITRAKLSDAKPAEIVELIAAIIGAFEPDEAPEGPFWRHAFDEHTLDSLLRLRAGLRVMSGAGCDALRGVLLGALHGPMGKAKQSYLSNQMPRTFASKPDYSVRYWEARKLRPPRVDLKALVADRAERFFGHGTTRGIGVVSEGDARTIELPRDRFSVVVTSPPYFGMNTYVPDQWLRHWFVGGPERPEYGRTDQIAHGKQEHFVAELAKVWRNVATACRGGATLVIRFGALRSRRCDPLAIIHSSLAASDTGWKVVSTSPAGDAHDGRRQAQQMGGKAKSGGTVDEHDIECVLHS